MAVNVDVDIFWEGSSIIKGATLGDQVISYERNQEMCTGEGFLTIEVIKPSASHNYQTWDEMVLYEDGSKVGTYYVSSVDESADGATAIIECQDGSKRLKDFFIAEKHQPETITYSRYWITRFLDEAGVSHNFTVADSGSPLSSNTALGPASAYDLIITLLQQSGWFIYFNANGVAQIGTLDIDLDNVDRTVTGNKITDLRILSHDRMLRNRAVVWGAGSGGTEWVFADISTTTPWNYDDADKRAVVVANSNIRSTGDAYSIAQKVLDEFARITVEKEVTFEGDNVTVRLGEVVKVQTSKYGGTGVVYTVGGSFSDKGLTKFVILDQRCPRLFGFASFSGEYVYVGTWGSGVWRRQVDATTWENFSTGLVGNGLYVDDLAIANGVFALRAGDNKAYYRTTEDSAWIEIEHGDFPNFAGPLHTADMVEAVAVAIDKFTSDIYIGFRPQVQADLYSWVIRYTPGAGITNRYQIKKVDQQGNDYNIRLMDLDTDDRKLAATVLAGGTIPITGECSISQFTTNLATTISGAPYDTHEPTEVYTKTIGAATTSRVSEVIVCSNLAWAIRYNNTNGDVTVYKWTQTGSGVDEDTYGTFSAVSSTVYRPGPAWSEDGDVLYFMIFEISGGSPYDYYVYKYDVDANSWSLDRTDTTTLTSFALVQGGGQHWKQYFYYLTSTNNSGLRAFSMNVVDWVTGTKQTHEFGSSGVSNPTAYDFLIGGGIAHAFNKIVAVQGHAYRFDTKSQAYLKMHWGTYSLVSDNFVDGTFGLWREDAPPGLISSFYVDGNGDWTEDISTVNSRSVAGSVSYSNLLSSVYGAFLLGYETGPSQPATYSGAGFYDPIAGATNYKKDGDAYYSGVISASNGPMYSMTSDTKVLIVEDNLGTVQVVTHDGEQILGQAGSDTTPDRGYGPLVTTDKDNGNIYYVESRAITGGRTYDLYQTTLTSGWVVVTRDGVGGNTQGAPADDALDGVEGEHNVVWSRPAEGGIQVNFFGDWEAFETQGYETLYGNEQGFTVVDQTPGPHLIEINKQSPIITYSISFPGTPDSLHVGYPNGISGISQVFTFLRRNPLGVSGITDARAFDLVQQSSFPTESGTYVPSGSRHLLIADGTKAYSNIATLGAQWQPLYTVTGSGVKHIETTNFLQPPHFFLSAKGGSGVASSFYQRLSNETSFTEKSTGLPSNEITVIRMDDRI